MLNNDQADVSKRGKKEEEISLSDLAEQLGEVQRECISENMPVLIIVDGWESAGKGYVINQLVRELDTKYFKVRVFGEDDCEEQKIPYSWRFWRHIPARGDFALFDRSFYFRIFNDPKMKKADINHEIDSLEMVEKMLRDDGMLILKFFLNISEKTQKERIEALQKDENREFLISKHDLNQNRNYDEYKKHFNLILERTNFEFSPWRIVSAEDRKEAAREILSLTIAEIQHELSQKKDPPKNVRTYNKKTTLLQNLRGDLTLSEKKYDDQIEPLQKKASELLFELYTKGISSLIVFEGMDAAGKGGAIQRLTRRMDPRLYEVNPTSAPSDPEKEHHYLWRFYNNFPARGRMAIFDRSWYGRVMVERVEGFARPDEWERAFAEINAMEQDLFNNRMLVLKYFLFIDSAEQLKRFEARQQDKPYKLTDEDWRNRDKWDSYIEAMNEMIDRTSTQSAPWILVEGNDKFYARVKVLETFIDQTEKRLKQLD
jgi:polyphosphate:AMP phosphotransferase